MNGINTPQANAHGYIQPPQGFGQRDHSVAPAWQAKQQQTIQNGGQAHGDGAEKHRDGGVPENPPRLVEKHHPACGIQGTEQNEQADGEHPQPFGDGTQAGQIDRQLRQGQRQHAGAHGRGKPVRGELANHFPGTGQVTEGFVAEGGRAGHDGNPLPRMRLRPS
ncbi:hypothetical protein QF045_002385 [Pseudomonas sp. W4I3]|nr:hypothetical protein [Pseudomonas sp. W4I3]